MELTRPCETEKVALVGLAGYPGDAMPIEVASGLGSVRVPRLVDPPGCPVGEMCGYETFVRTDEIDGQGRPIFRPAGAPPG